jgi:tRNA-Thr(GGU) m(6)t(6)A37 methyltransferase TsaA
VAELRIQGLKQVAQHAPDLDASVAFYRDVLGLPFEAEFDPPGLAFFDLGDTRLLLDANESVTPAILYFRVDDIAEAHAALEAKGVVFEQAPAMIHRHDGTFDGDGVEEWMAFFKDPAGCMLALASRVEPAWTMTERPWGYAVRPIGWVRSGRDEAIDDDWDAVTASIELDADQFGPEALAGLDDFSHVEVLFLFDRVAVDAIVYGARHPRGRSDWPRVGIFAQRAKDRPNRIGSTICDIIRVNGLTLEVSGLDAIEGTPVLDLKPYMDGFAARGDVFEPPWATELMRDYW